jgi:hypothetical protein
MVDYNYIYSAYIVLYKYTFATNLQLQYNSLIIWCGILFIDLSYFCKTIALQL